MKRYILFLRGINVGRTKRIKTQEIATFLSALFDDVLPYGQSGNFLFRTDLQMKDILPKIQTNFEANFGFSASCLVMTVDELSKVFGNNPFPDVPKDRLYFIFVDRPIPQGKMVWEHNGDVAKGSDSTIYLDCRGGYHKTKLTNNFFEKELGAVCTARNWNTVDAVLRL